MSETKSFKFDWVDALKGMGIIGIMLVHLVEKFPQPESAPLKVLHWLGLQGDHAPGVFFLLSGFGLTLSLLKKGVEKIDVWEFYEKRLSRLLPLYIAIFLFFLALMQFGGFGKSDTLVSDGNTFIRLWGLGFTDATFNYINPSWWFVWTIIQFYLIFPWLYKFFVKSPTSLFLVGTIGFTLLTRYLGLEGIRFNENLAYWERGIFFGSRLAEFALGMSLAKWIFSHRDSNIGMRLILPISLVVYALGVFSVSFPITRPFFAIFKTVGLSGIFYSLWLLIQGNKFSASYVGRPLIWMGLHSYALFIFHQVPLNAIDKFFADKPLMMFLAGIAVLLIAIPASFVAEIVVDRLMIMLKKIRSWTRVTPLLAVLSLALLAALFVLPITKFEGMLQQGIYYALLVWVLAILFIWFRSANRSPIVDFLSLGAVFAGFTYIYGIPPSKKLFAIGFGLVLAAFVVGSILISRRLKFGWLIPTSFIALLMVGETICRIYFPMQSGEIWGELPAMMMDDKLTFKLIPNKTTHLKYDGMDFVLTTNSMGMNGPEIEEERPTSNTFRVLIIGDAIAMPEGYEYQNAFPHLLEVKLADYLGAARPVQVINAAVTGYGPYQQVELLPELVEMYKPDVVLYEFFNEYTQNVDAVKGKEIKSIKGRQKAVGFFPYGEGPKLYDHVLRSQLVINIRRRGGALVKEKIMGKPKPSRYARALIPYFERGNPIYSEEKLSNLKIHLRELKEVSEQAGSEFYLVYVPPASAVIPYTKLDYFPWNINLADSSRYDITQPNRYTASVCRDLDMQLIDVTEGLKTFREQPTFFTHAWHMSDKGHKAITMELFERMRSDGLLEEKEAVDFVQVKN